jgi:hypothetical protein
MGPKGKPLIHMCHPSECLNRPVPLAVRYIGPRAHASRVWAVLWGSRPRLVRSAPRAGEGVSSSGASGIRNNSVALGPKRRRS